MNCSEALSLFSARVDNELDSEVAFRLEDHLDQCSECQRQWTGFYSTIRMVRGLPKEETDPAFVGQVLDRVRTYEAEGDPFLEPVDRPFVEPALTVPKVTWFQIARARVRSWAQPAPALAVGSLALGVGLGLFAFSQDEPVESNASLAGGTVATAAATRATDSTLASGRPFADIADEIRISESTETFWNAPGTGVEPYAGSSGLQQQVRLGRDAPRITF